MGGGLQTPGKLLRGEVVRSSCLRPGGGLGQSEDPVVPAAPPH